MKTIEQLETEYQNAWEAYKTAQNEYRNNWGSEAKYLSARAACIAAGNALNAAQVAA